MYLKQNGKKVRLNFDLHSIEADKLFEVPMELFQFVHADGTKEGGKKGAESPEDVKAMEPESTNLFREPT
jgi:hypothetical protein